MKVTVIASPYANLANIIRALRYVGADAQPTAEPDEIAAARKLVLPGVGNFAAARQWLQDAGVEEPLAHALHRGARLLGICVGHQLLFDDSSEQTSTRGLGLIRGQVRQFPPGLPVPQVGWNRVSVSGDPLFAGIESGTPFYFVNSYRATEVPPDCEIGRSEYGVSFTAAVRRSDIWGVQFHPEKSSFAGLRVLRNFVEL